jgi:peptidoglycan LD-endopeptidase LytH
VRAILPLSAAALCAAGIVYYGIHYRREHSVVFASTAPRAAAHSHAKMVMPIEGLRAAAIHDTFDQSRGNGERLHEATDILAPRGTPVRAMVDGVIKKLFLSKPGGNTIYEFGDDGEYCYYYAHLDRYAAGLTEGQKVRAGDVIGYVGTTGNADPNTPHLHLAFFRLGPEKRWWQGTPVNPYPTLMELLHRE